MNPWRGQSLNGVLWQVSERKPAVQACVQRKGQLDTATLVLVLVCRVWLPRSKHEATNTERACLVTPRKLRQKEK